MLKKSETSSTIAIMSFGGHGANGMERLYSHYSLGLRGDNYRERDS